MLGLGNSMIQQDRYVQPFIIDLSKFDLWEPIALSESGEYFTANTTVGGIDYGWDLKAGVGSSGSSWIVKVEDAFSPAIPSWANRITFSFSMKVTTNDTSTGFVMYIRVNEGSGEQVNFQVDGSNNVTDTYDDDDYSFVVNDSDLTGSVSDMTHFRFACAQGGTGSVTQIDDFRNCKILCEKIY